MKKPILHYITRSMPSPEVFLTFDDGPHPEYTPRILALLKAHGISATFFLEGKKVNRYRTIVRDIADEGHCIGNHSYRHARLLFKSKRFLLSEIEQTDESIADITGTEPRLFRPPYGQFGPRLLRIIKQKQKRIVLWNISGRDYEQSATSDRIANRLMQIRDGQIVLLHDGHRNSANTVSALGSTLNHLKQDRVHFNSLHELESNKC